MDRKVPHGCLPLTKEFRIDMARFEIPVSGWTCLRTAILSARARGVALRRRFLIQSPKPLTLVNVGGVCLLARLGALLLVTGGSSLLAGILLLGSLGSGSGGLGGRLLVSGLGRHFGAGKIERCDFDKNVTGFVDGLRTDCCECVGEEVVDGRRMKLARGVALL